MPSSGPAPGIGAGGGLGGSLGVGVGGVGMASLTGSSGSRGRPSSFDAQGALQLPPPIPHHGRHLQFGSGGSSSPGGAGGGLGIPPIQHLQSHSGGHHGHHQGGYEAIKTEEEYGHGPLVRNISISFMLSLLVLPAYPLFGSLLFFHQLHSFFFLYSRFAIERNVSNLGNASFPAFPNSRSASS